MMKEDILDKLIEKGDIKSYKYYSKDSVGNIGKDNERGRNTECLEITFKSGHKLVIDTFCSGSYQNTIMHFSK